MALAHTDIQPLQEIRRTPGHVDLFTFSAAMGIAHRIHFDADYTRDEEGHPALLVQGPLQAAYICQALQHWAERHGCRARIESLKYRHRKPVYVDTVLVAGGELQSFDATAQQAHLSVWVKVDGEDEEATRGEATVTLGRD